MYRKNIYAIPVSGNYSRWIFIVAARDKAAAIQMVKEVNSEESGHYLPDELYIESIDESDVSCIAVDAAVENEGIIFDDGYTE